MTLQLFSFGHYSGFGHFSGCYYLGWIFFTLLSPKSEPIGGRSVGLFFFLSPAFSWLSGAWFENSKRLENCAAASPKKIEFHNFISTVSDFGRFWRFYFLKKGDTGRFKNTQNPTFFDSLGQIRKDRGNPCQNKVKGSVKSYAVPYFGLILRTLCH